MQIICIFTHDYAFFLQDKDKPLCCVKPKIKHEFFVNFQAICDNSSGKQLHSDLIFQKKNHQSLDGFFNYLTTNSS